MSRVGLAAITLDRSGGGVAVASRLIWQVIRERWAGESRLVTLLHGSRPPAAEATTSARVRFGVNLLAAQAFGDCRWIFYSHLGVAQVQQYVPAPFRKPYGVFLHGIEVWRPLTTAQRRVLEGASVLIANSAFTARRVTEAHPWVGAIASCPLSLPRDEESQGLPGASGTGISLGPHAVIMVGRMAAAEQYKGHDQLLEAWPAVRARVPDATLAFVGTGDDAPRLKEKARHLNLGSSVIFTGFVPDPELTSLYRQAAVFAMPSREEGFGLAYLEAMAHRLPCIGSRHDAAADVIVDGVTGYLVDQSAAPALVEGIVTLLTDEARRVQMGERGYDRLHSCFSYGRFRDRLLAQLTAGFGTRNEAVPRLAG